MESYGQRSNGTQQWPPHLLTTTQGYALTSPAGPTAGDQQYPGYYREKEPQHGGLSLNMSGLSVTSPSNLSPINNPASSSASALSPVTPISPPFGAHTNHSHPSFSFDDDNGVKSSPVPSRKRSFSSTPVMEEPFSDSDTPMDLGFDEAQPQGNTAQPPANPYPPTPVSQSSPVDEDTNKLNGLTMPTELSMLGKPLATNNFVTKLYQMISSPSSSAFISWTDLGTSFVVSNVGEFSRTVLGSHFKHNNFSSFVRQLNMYGFHKINRTPRAQRTSTDAQTWEFSHHKFLRGRPDLLDEIKRKALEPDLGVKQRVELPGEVAAQLTSMRDDNRRMWEQLVNEKRKVEKLVTVVRSLWDVVGRIGALPPFPADLLESIESPNIFVTSPTSPTTGLNNATSSTQPSSPASATTRLTAPGLSLSIHHPHHPHHQHHTLMTNSPGSSPTTADFPHSIVPVPVSVPSMHHPHHPHHAHPHININGGHHRAHTLSRQHSYQHISSLSSPNSASPVNGLPPVDLFGSTSSASEVGNDDEVNVRSGTLKRQRMSTDDLHSSLSSPAPIADPSSCSSPSSTASSTNGIGASSTTPIATNATLTPPKKPFSRARSDSAPLGYHTNGTGAGPNTNPTQHHLSAPSMDWSPTSGSGGPTPPSTMGRPRSGSGMVLSHSHHHHLAHSSHGHHVPALSSGLGHLHHIPQQQRSNTTGSMVSTPMLTISTVVPSNG